MSMSTDAPSALQLIFTLLFVYALSTISYRLYLHPLANVPGPKLAAITYLYEIYYDVVLDGQFVFKLQKLHSRYGRIVRLNPDSVHIQDHDFFNQAYGFSGGKSDKSYNEAIMFGSVQQSLSTADYHIHRARRAPLNKFFSRQSVLELLPWVHSIIDKFLDKLDQACRNDKLVNLKYGYAALASDLTTEYCFSRDWKRLDELDFGAQEFDNLDTYLDISRIEWFQRMCSPAMANTWIRRKKMETQIDDIRTGRDLSYQTSGHRTVFHEILESDISPSEKNVKRLADEAFSIIYAAYATSKDILKMATYFTSTSQAVHDRLLTELRTIMPHPTSNPPLSQLEELPYLRAVILEAIRMASNFSHRRGRVFPKPLHYGGHALPAGTVITCTTLLLDYDESVFPEPRCFKPERWLGGSKQEQKAQESRLVVAFSRGTRTCPGMNLAWAELYIIVAATFRRFEFDMEGVVRARDIDIVRDNIFSQESRESKGLVVKVRRVKE